MKHNYTIQPIISYIYKELDLFSRLEFEFALEEDSTLLEQYNTLKFGYEQLPKVRFSPSQSSIDKILHYSKSVAEV